MSTMAREDRIAGERANPDGKQPRYFDTPDLREWCFTLRLLRRRGQIMPKRTRRDDMNPESRIELLCRDIKMVFDANREYFGNPKAWSADEKRAFRYARKAVNEIYEALAPRSRRRD